MKKKKPREKLDTILKVVGLLIIIIAVLLVILIIPEFLFLIKRDFIEKFLKLSGVYPNTYVQELLIIMTTLVTAYLGWCTYNLSRKIAGIDFEDSNAKKMLHAFRLLNNTELVCSVIWKKSENYGDLKELEDNNYIKNEYLESILYLFSAAIINEEERDVLYRFYDELNNVVKSSKNSSINSTAFQDKVNSFADKYLIERNQNYEMSDRLKKNINKLGECLGRQNNV